MESLKNKVAIVGVGYTPQGTVPGRTTLSFHIEAARNAIEDAGLKIEDVDGILTQAMGGVASSWGIIAEQLGMRIRFGSDQSSMGATAGGMVLHAGAALVYGLANYVVCIYGENSVSPDLTSRPRAGGMPYAGAFGDAAAAAFGSFGAAAGYAMAARRGMHEFGIGPEAWSKIAVAQRKWANLNPRAVMYNKKLSFEDYYNSKIYVAPLRQADMCLVTNSGRAFVMTTVERAKDCKHNPVYVLGVGQDHPATGIIQSNFMAGPIGSKVAGETAMKMAGVTIKDIDACEIYDCFTYTVELTMMGYGFFRPGEGKDFFANGRTAPGGEFPVNTSGGLLSEAYQMGFTPLTEAVVQLQGRAGERQLGPATKTKEPNVILVSGNGGVLQTHSTTILGRQ